MLTATRSTLVSAPRRASIMWRNKIANKSTTASAQWSQVTTTAASAPPTTHRRTSVAMRCIEWYSNKLDTHPLLTKAITGGLIAGAGDGLCQSLIQVDQPYDWVRTVRFGAVGTLYIAPGIHYWYNILATRLAPGTSAVAVLKRVALDQFVFAPPFIAGLLTTLWTAEGFPIIDIPNRLATTLPDVVMANWVLWIPANILNFGFVPIKYQVLFNNTLGLVWNAYLSFSAQQKSEHSTEQYLEEATK